MNSSGFKFARLTPQPSIMQHLAESENSQFSEDLYSQMVYKRIKTSNSLYRPNSKSQLLDLNDRQFFTYTNYRSSVLQKSRLAKKLNVRHAMTGVSRTYKNNVTVLLIKFLNRNIEDQVFQIGGVTSKQKAKILGPTMHLHPARRGAKILAKRRKEQSKPQSRKVSSSVRQLAAMDLANNN